MTDELKQLAESIIRQASAEPRMCALLILYSGDDFHIYRNIGGTVDELVQILEALASAVRIKDIQGKVVAREMDKLQ